MDTVMKPVSKRELAKQEQEAARQELLNLFAGNEKPVIGTILRHTSASGMSHDISLYYGEQNITYTVALALGDKVRNSNGFNAIRVNGCGMDMGFHLVYTLSVTLFGHNERNGYRLSHRWL